MNLEHLPQAPQDKANHHLYGQAAAVAGAVVFHLLGADERIGAGVAALALGVGKELWDKASGLGDPSVADALATASGALPLIIGLTLGALA